MAVYEVTLEGELDANPMVTVLHYDISNSTNFGALAQEILLLMIADLVEFLVPSASYSGITVREDVPGGVGTFYAFTGGPAAGTNVDDRYWGIICAQVRKLTSSGLRPAQGRVFQGGIPASNVDTDGRVVIALRVALTTFWEEMRDITFDTTGHAEMVIKASNPTAPNTVAYNPVTAINVSSKPAKQSRRNAGD
jgi:hypothetical protein